MKIFTRESAKLPLRVRVMVRVRVRIRIRVRVEAERTIRRRRGHRRAARRAALRPSLPTSFPAPLAAPAALSRPKRSSEAAQVQARRAHRSRVPGYGVHVALPLALVRTEALVRAR